MIDDPTVIASGTGSLSLLDMVAGRAEQAFRSGLRNCPQVWRAGL